MRYLILSFVVLSFFYGACSSIRPIEAPKQKVEFNTEDSISYELLILDLRYDSFLATQPPAELYSQSYYEAWNRRYVLEWNIRHSSPLRYGDFYQTRIDYDPHEDYGLDLNYRLYYYFLFIEKEYGIRLIRRRGN